jgi:hypothetical protein
MRDDEDVIRRGTATQQRAVEAVLDVVGTTGGKATVETVRPRPVTSYDKIRLKGGPKQYKRGAGPAGAERLHARVVSLLAEATRVARRLAARGRPGGDIVAQDAEYAYALALHGALKTFLDERARR